MKTAITAGLAAAAGATPALAQIVMKGPEGPIRIETVSAFDIIADSMVLHKLVLLILLISTIAAIVVCFRKLRAGPNLSGGSAFLSSLRAGGPLLGLIGAGLGLVNTSIGIMAVGGATGQTPSLAVVIPGLIECLLVAIFGLVTGVVAIACHWAVEARIDRQVLKS